MGRMLSLKIHKQNDAVENEFVNKHRFEGVFFNT